MSDGTRLTRLIQRLDFARPGKAFEEGWYVAPPGPGHAAARIAARFGAATAPRLLFLGGVGTGKSTALLAAQRALGERAHYLSLDALFDAGGARPGALLVLAGLAILRAIEANAGHLASHLGPTKRLLHRSLKVRGRPASTLVDANLIEPGASEAPETVLGHLETLTGRWRELRARGAPPVVLLVDSLDRRTWSQFEANVLPDLEHLGAYDVGIAIAGSTSWRAAADEDVRGRFHELWTEDACDTRSPEQHAFLRSVLAARDEGALSDVVRDAAIDRSGGVLRDLLKVADAAARDAAAEGAVAVNATHVDAAAAAMGADALGMLAPSLRARFAAWRHGGAELDDRELESLRARGCVVEHRGVWAEHPLLRGVRDRDEAA